MEEKLKQCFCEAFGDELPQSTDEWNATEINDWDSLGHVILMNLIEQNFEVTIPEQDYLKYLSYSTILAFLKEQVKN